MTGLTLQHFISEALSQILVGIEDARGAVQEKGIKGHRISPAISHVGMGQEIHDADVAVFLQDGEICKAHLVQFDVAVHATEAVGGKAGIQVSALGVRGGVGGDLSAEEKTISRIKFDIPIILQYPPKMIGD